MISSENCGELKTASGFAVTVAVNCIKISVGTKGVGVMDVVGVMVGVRVTVGERVMVAVAVSVGVLVTVGEGGNTW